MRENRGPDGGLFAPKTIPYLSKGQLDEILNSNSNDCIASILNLLLDSHLSGWDVDFCIGRRCLRTVPLGHRIVIGECWHNPAQTFSETVKSLSRKICQENVCSIWAEISVRIAVLFVFIGQLMQENSAVRHSPVDISVLSGDFLSPISAWYAREMGLPIGNIIACCNENHSVWELFHYGQLRTDGIAIPSSTPEGDVLIPAALESLIYHAGGCSAAHAFVSDIREGKLYVPDDSILAAIRKGLYISVVSEERMENTIVNTLQSFSYLLSPYAALGYAGVQDYRAKTGESRLCLLLSEKSPSSDKELIQRILGGAYQDLQKYI